MRDADRGFRESLDDGQRQALTADGFDMTTALDPSILLTRVMALAAVTESGDDDDDANPGDGDAPR